GLWDYVMQLDPPVARPERASGNVAGLGGIVDPASIAPETMARCAGCADDDSNGLVDLEEPSCCDERVTLRDPRARVSSVGGRTRLGVAGWLDGVEAVETDAAGVRVQVRDAHGALVLCDTVAGTSHGGATGRLFHARAAGGRMGSTGVDRLLMRSERE